MVDTPTADNPREPDISHVNPAAQDTWFEHPRQLKRLFTTEMWERFGYYGMRALLTLYLANYFLFNDSTTTGLYGGFTALVYLTPLIGGLLADRYLGSKRSVKFGAILMAAGLFHALLRRPAGDALCRDRRPALSRSSTRAAARRASNSSSIDGQQPADPRQ